MVAKYIMNSDVMCHCNTSPRAAKIGTQLVVTKDLEECPWKNKGGIINPGTYVVVSRKHFNGGVLVIEEKI